MAYVVNITNGAVRDLGHVDGTINAEHSEAALKRYRRLREAILSLEGYPNRGRGNVGVREMEQEVPRGLPTGHHPAREVNPTKPVALWPSTKACPNWEAASPKLTTKQQPRPRGHWLVTLIAAAPASRDSWNSHQGLRAV
jgi:hypothetical protein